MRKQVASQLYTLKITRKIMRNMGNKVEKSRKGDRELADEETDAENQLYGER